MTSPLKALKTPVIVYPESDGNPMAENTLQFDWITLVKFGTEAAFADRDDVFIAGDLLWYPLEGHPEIRIAPDVLVAFGRPKGRRGSYLQWKEDNIPPQVVFEILSPGNSRGEMDSKVGFYQKHGVKEYIEYDPDRNILRVWLRQNDELIPIPAEMLRDWISPLLQVRFLWTDEHLELFHSNGEPFRSHAELRQLLKQEQQHAINEQQRAEQERQRADALAQEAELERRRVAELEARLRQMEEALQKSRNEKTD